jgi:hydrogenase maturation protein HypF
LTLKRESKLGMSSCKRLRLDIQGAVQGVGFRPFVYRLARSIGLNGWVTNSSQGVAIEVEGDMVHLQAFQLRLPQEKPSPAFIQSLETHYLDPVGLGTFEIRQSLTAGKKTALVLPDIATCPECLNEIFNPTDRRFQYPFTNCTLCGPRYSIIEALPYDRPSTSMKHFKMCPACEAEYHDPLNRRFHAQPNACPLCGPRLSLMTADGIVIATGHHALTAAAARLRDGAILALKGVGGFHLMADAADDTAIVRLRRRKRRGEKPFAVMVPDLPTAERVCQVDCLERQLLTSPAAPIVILKRRIVDGTVVSLEVAPGNPTLGLMLPYSPLHHLLLYQIGRPVVATSGNRSDEPICIDDTEALERLQDIADIFLMHDRPIVRPVDDSVVMVMLGREMMLRRSRGYAPLPVKLRNEGPDLLAVGAHLKNTVALRVGSNAFISQHIGNLETEEAFVAFQQTINNLKGLFAAAPTAVVCDRHPGYRSTRYASKQSDRLLSVQHHHAHILSCMAENEVEGPVLGIAWDGSGYGDDGTIWGGEFLLVDENRWRRIAAFRTFGLPGGATAVREPRRSALGLLYELFGDRTGKMTALAPIRSFDDRQRRILLQMITQSVNTPRTSSVGRLFDSVAALIGLRQIADFEGQAAMELEFSIGSSTDEPAYPFAIGERIDWQPLIESILADLAKGISADRIAGRFHQTLAEIITQAAHYGGEKQVVLTGGCFQNRYLTERAITRLQQDGFQVYWHQRLPPNDGGIALGQLIAADRLLNNNCPSGPVVREGSPFWSETQPSVRESTR